MDFQSPDRDSVVVVEMGGTRPDGDIGTCTGTLLSYQVVLTAAHCLVGSEGTPVYAQCEGTSVQVGRNYGGTDVRYVESCHPYWQQDTDGIPGIDPLPLTPEGSAQDVMLLFLEPPEVSAQNQGLISPVGAGGYSPTAGLGQFLDRTNPQQLVATLPASGFSGEIVGWGTIETKEFPFVRRFQRIDPFDYDRNPASGLLVKVFPAPYSGPDEGDSGGPLFSLDSNGNRLGVVGVDKAGVAPKNAGDTTTEGSATWLDITRPDIGDWIDATMADPARPGNVIGGRDYMGPCQPEVDQDCDRLVDPPMAEVTFRITGVRTSVASGNDLSDEIRIETNWDTNEPEEDLVFFCGITYGAGSSIPCANPLFKQYPEFLEQFSDFLLLESNEYYLRRQTVSFDDQTTSIDVEVALGADHLVSTLFAGFTLNIDLATGTYQPVAGLNQPGFRHDGGTIGVVGNHHCQSPGARPECGHDCVFLGSEWELCYTVEVECVPSSSTDATCDGKDDDCDGVPDDDFVTMTQPCGLPGACQGSLQISCIEGATVAGPCTGQSEPTIEICDGVNNDCDNNTDEDPFFVNTCDPGECAAQATASCVGNEVVVQCGVPGLETCDGLDNDCDGDTDEDPFFVADQFCEGECASAAVATCVGTQLSITCGLPDVELCDELDHNCNGDPYDADPVPSGQCGVGACLREGIGSCVNGTLVTTCIPGSPSPEVFDLEDNDCDGSINECDPGQTDWWCCSENEVITLDFNVVSAPDVVPAAACIPLSEDPSATCSLRGVFQVADQTIANGCHIAARMQSGEYRITEELPLRRGRLRLVGAGQATTLVRPDTTCIPTCGDSTCGSAADHRLVSVTAASSDVPFLQVEDLSFRGGHSPGNATPFGSYDDGGAILVEGSLFLAERIVIEDNRAPGHGAGIAVYDSLAATIRDSVIRNNINAQAGCSPWNETGGGVTARGGGVYSADSVMTIERTAILGNTSSDGGGIAAQSSGTFTLINSTVADNSASAAGGGILSEVELNLFFNTLADNSSGYKAVNDEDKRGGGLAVNIRAGSVAPVLNGYGNILSRNTTGVSPLLSNDCSIRLEPDPPGVILNAALNLIEDDRADCAPLANPALDLLGVSAWYEEPFPLPVDATPVTSDFLVYPLNSNSPAIGVYPAPGGQPAGAFACPVVDQRRYLRPLDAACTLGAYEADGIPDTDGDGIPDTLDPEPALFSDFFTDAAVFGNTSGTIVNRGGQLLVVHDRPGLGEGVVVVADARGTAAPAQISACGGTVQVTVAAGQSVPITCPRPTSCVFAEQDLIVFDRSRVSSAAFSGAFTVYHDAVVGGDVAASGSGALFDRAIIGGNATLGGTLTGNRQGVRGTLSEMASVTAQSLRVRNAAASGGDVTVAFDGEESLAPAEYGHVLVHSRGTLSLLEAGVYRFSSLRFETDAFFDIAPSADGVVVLVEGDLIVGDRVVMRNAAQTTLEPDDALFYVGGTSIQIGHDTQWAGAIEGPFAAVEVRDRSVLNGCVGAKSVTLGHDSVVGDGTAPM